MSTHDQHEEARLALESGVAAVEKIIRQRDEALASQGEPSDAEIDAAARAMFAITNQLSMSGARDLARAALRAAGVGGAR